jgi:hypothetical protein
MYILVVILIFLSACIILFFYQLYHSYSEEKSTIQSLIQKYISYLRKFTNIYEEILQEETNQVEQDLLNKNQDMNDTFVSGGKKTLIKAIRDQSVYRRIINLDGYFSRIKEWEKTISSSDLKSSKSSMNSSSLSRMLQVFLGDVRKGDGSFDRYDFREYIEDIFAILEYLNRVNTHFLLRFLMRLSSKTKEDIKEANSFIVLKESELDSLRWRLEKLRLLEKKYLIEQKNSFAMGDEPQQTAN